jgi:hypothetical protein
LASFQRIDSLTPINVTYGYIKFSRVYIGLIVLVCAEVFSGASLGLGLWHPFTILMTYWIYFAHFFLFTTLAIRTGRTSLPSLYLWGILFGSYEFFITKVPWYGYGGSGTFVIGGIGPYGFSETSMVFLFHPVMSFILPLVVACIICPPLRRVFPDLAWFTGQSRGALAIQIYMVVSFALIMAINSRGVPNLLLNLAFVLVLLWLLRRKARPTLANTDGLQIMAFGRRGFIGLCIYLALLYAVTYRGIHPEGLPTVPVQLFTFVFYGIAILGLWKHQKPEPLAQGPIPVEQQEPKRIIHLFIAVCILALPCAALVPRTFLYPVIMVNFGVWGVLAVVLTILALVKGRTATN